MSYYSAKLEEGLQFQDHVTSQLHSQLNLFIQNFSSKKFQLQGENPQGIEIKLDNRFRTTNNLYIETHEKTNPTNEQYYPSGINRNDNSWLFIIGDYQTLYMFSVKQLRKLAHTLVKVQTPTSQGVLLPLPKATNWALNILHNPS